MGYLMGKRVVELSAPLMSESGLAAALSVEQFVNPALITPKPTAKYTGFAYA
ncbi:hypothetical protein [Alkalimarinus coralli]|uniref:hypothetical protein n=1 Tax=Alkalimarinus coralli TaxID=2935863 RepID=UPI00202B1302|nr:hypothetical protein [Alkalimarinus coralli]